MSNARSCCLLLLPACTPRSFSPALLAPTPRAPTHTTHCRRVSLALRISSECAVDVCAEINAAAPPDQQRFPVSCEVTGLRSELRYPDRVSVSPPPTGCRCLPPRPGVGVSPPPRPGVGVSPSSVSPPPPVPSAVGRLKQEKPTLGSALIHGGTLLWSANITAKQVKYRVILWVSWRVTPHCLDRWSFMSM